LGGVEILEGSEKLRLQGIVSEEFKAVKKHSIPIAIASICRAPHTARHTHVEITRIRLNEPNLATLSDVMAE